MNKGGLTMCLDLTRDAASARARVSLLETVFEGAPPDLGLAPRWVASGYIDDRGDCIASLDFARLDLMLDGHIQRAGGIRLVAVHPDWRGRGLSRDLMIAALEALDSAGSGLVLLYAEFADLYRRYGFTSVRQHAFLGDAPHPRGVRHARALDPTSDRLFIERLLARRMPVSDLCALVGAPSLFFERLLADPGLRLAYLTEEEAIVAYEIEDDTLVLVDIVAEKIPPLATVVGAVRGSFERVKTMFPPDRLAWRGTPVPDDTGLMIRGDIPPAMTVPFMLPPTAEF